MKRVQMRRGVKLPPNTKYVGRPSRWGNAFRIAPHGPYSREFAIELYRGLVRERLAADEEYGEHFLGPLRGFHLACYCPLDQPCHADVLLELIEELYAYAKPLFTKRKAIADALRDAKLVDLPWAPYEPEPGVVIDKPQHDAASAFHRALWDRGFDVTPR